MKEEKIIEGEATIHAASPEESLSDKERIAALEKRIEALEKQLTAHSHPFGPEFVDHIAAVAKERTLKHLQERMAAHLAGLFLR